jgi:hypothetical protein
MQYITLKRTSISLILIKNKILIKIQGQFSLQNNLMKNHRPTLIHKLSLPSILTLKVENIL